ncbi:hypothetical protein GCM10025867_25320 [Frondihabitans sucicola]|uniref:Peptidase S9 prolyl oligopeptidase catalytic domain-containing protein n=1 Tax=Frondihabitans sucicola TaxID=1268041 RepID=A0ABN6XZD3_9MICO|nr:prolyl oligopeptidase family serine peptidase [Frondihabitans sucicola]BDZ50291.1 hypothetical protein GCM10025867_25320 [Frondihabitans sucicola]
MTAVPSLPEGLVEPTLETFAARDGLDVTGWLYRAGSGSAGGGAGSGRAVGSAGSSAGPALVHLHGGPESQERPTFSPQHQALVAAGITVFAPNIRGSSGFGKEFVHADDLEKRWAAHDDVVDCARFLVSTGVADPARIAVTGRSYGGYATLAALAFSPDVFACGIDICGMSDLGTFYRDTEPWIAAAATTKYGHPVDDAELLAALSPLGSASSIRVPLLVVHGELDTNVPIGEAHQIVEALTSRGAPVEYLELDGEGHEYRRLASRRKLIARLVSFTRASLGV